MKRKLHEVFKGEDGKWKVQATKGMMSFKLKRNAVKYSEEAKELNLK